MNTRLDAEDRHPFIPQELAIKAMRDNGYRNTAYALAELIDNSYQAIEQVQRLDEIHVGQIEVIVVEEPQMVEQRIRTRPTRLAVVDNGCGMDVEGLRNALQFGNGTNLLNRDGIGRFGMGLPNSTVSQCRRADIWTWRRGSSSAIHSFLDLDEIECGRCQDVPTPTEQPVPDEWLAYAPLIGDTQHGTLVVWSDLDRVLWRTARSTVENTEALIGRIYRKLMAEGLLLSITVVSDGAPTRTTVRPNDPLYLTAGSSTPAPFDSKPMFQPYGVDGRQVFPVEFGGEVHEVVLTFSFSRPEARLLPDGGEPGNTPWGKHARSNVGVSVVRADRELQLDMSWTNNDLRERWWGAEVSFPPALDEVFGVTNNKQYAVNFSEIADYYRDTRNDDEWQEIRREWDAGDEPQRHLVDICNFLFQQLQQMRGLLREQTKGVRSTAQKRHDVEVEARATTAFRRRADEGQDAGDADRDVSPDEKRVLVESSLVQKMAYEESTARELAEVVATKDLKVIFIQRDNPESDSFFHVEVIPGVTEVVFNTSHRAFGMLFAALDPPSEDESTDQLRARIHDASSTLKLLLAAWARFEAEEKFGNRQDRLRKFRQDWGRMANAFLEDPEISPDDIRATLD